MQSITFRMDKQSGPTLLCSELYPVSQDNGKEYLKKNAYMYVSESHCLTENIRTTWKSTILQLKK